MPYVKVRESKRKCEHAQIHYMKEKNAHGMTKLIQYLGTGSKQGKLPVKTQNSAQVSAKLKFMSFEETSYREKVSVAIALSICVSSANMFHRA